jgi:hypothetical protein
MPWTRPSARSQSLRLRKVLNEELVTTILRLK